MMTGTDLMSCSISGESGGLAMKTRPMLTPILLSFCLYHHHHHHHHYQNGRLIYFQDSKIGTYNKMWRFMEQVFFLHHDNFNIVLTILGSIIIKLNYIFAAQGWCICNVKPRGDWQGAEQEGTFRRRVRFHDGVNSKYDLDDVFKCAWPK